MPRVDDALQFIISCLRSSPMSARNYGYDVYIPNVCRTYVREVEHITDQTSAERRAHELIGGVFYDAAWELCRRGILRPSVRGRNEQSTDDGSAGNGYSITTLGRSWLDENQGVLFIPTEPSRVAELIGRFRGDFGDGFFQRAQEAVRCYSAGAYLACCVMCGAAMESVLLHLAIQKNGDEVAVMRTYRTSMGRSRVETIILQGVPDHLARTFRSSTDLLKYWRDDASHGAASVITEFEAYEAISRLLRFVLFAVGHLPEFTGSPRRA
ncbi:MAG: hypothetical protein LiPW15_621 [Parcubacteria group bacterium LiPW_15]|nr:MAG: hypothetical protein LiPW15_621 [Parcubacteria group bacterium LiPW_15]